MTRPGTLLRLAAAVLVTAAATLALPVSPARAAASCSDQQVGVLVDYGALGGGTATGCGSGSTADKAFTSAGVSLKQDTRQAGFVCQVEGKPADRNCLGTDSYWGFFVSDEGKGWVYASLGVYQQAVDAGDSVALVWQCSKAQRKPGGASDCTEATPTQGAPGVPGSGKTTRQPKPKPTKDPVRPTATASPSAAAPTPSATVRETATATATPTRRHSRTATPSPSTTPSTSAAVPTTPPTTPSPTEGSTTDAIAPTAADDDGGLPGWVAPAVVALLALAAGGIAWVRRAR